MRTIKAYRQQYSFATGPEAERYELFLKKHLLELNPNFYGITHKRKIKTKDGLMYAVHLSTAIEDPNLESIAEGEINSQQIYLWRDRCWTIAVDGDNKLLCRYDLPTSRVGQDLRNLNPCWEVLISNYQNKSLILYPIGTDPI